MCLKGGPLVATGIHASYENIHIALVDILNQSTEAWNKIRVKVRKARPAKPHYLVVMI